MSGTENHRESDNDGRSDADRRVRQAERLARLLQLLRLIMGRGRWDADALARELDCSRRTIFRLLNTLSLAGVPWHFDESTRAYRVRSGYRFPFIEDVADRDPNPTGEALRSILEPVIRDAETLATSLSRLTQSLRELMQADE